MHVILIIHKYRQDKVFYYLLQLPASKLCSNTRGKSVSSERDIAGFPQFEKKCHIKFTLSRQMGHKKTRPKNKCYFLE